MSNPDQITYGRSARLRAAVAKAAAEISDSAASLVTTYADGDTLPGELAGQARQLTVDARELERLAVACERAAGASWDTLAGSLGLNSRQAAHDRYGTVARQLEESITESWLLGDPSWLGTFPGLPGAAVRTAGTAALLDRWVLDRLPGQLAQQSLNSPEHPVSAGLRPMDTSEHAALVTAAAALIAAAQAEAAGWQSPPQLERVRQLELGLARRKVELYERMLADDPGGLHATGDVHQTRDLLAGARARLAELEADERASS
jgi:hypothetical protein